MNDITDKQQAYIESIEDVVGVPFNGSTKEEASAYISEHVDEFRKRSALEGELDFIAQHPKFS